MAEVLAGVAAFELAGTILEFAVFSGKVLNRLNEFRALVGEVPRALQDFEIQLSLLRETLNRTKQQADADVIDSPTRKAMQDAVRACEVQVRQFDTILTETLPVKGDSRWKRVKKAFVSVKQEKAVRLIVGNLRHYISLLTYHQVTPFTAPLLQRKKPVQRIPFGRDSHFIGREQTLEQLDNRLNEHRRVAVIGIGGIGYIFLRLDDLRL